MRAVGRGDPPGLRRRRSRMIPAVWAVVVETGGTKRGCWLGAVPVAGLRRQLQVHNHANNRRGNPATASTVSGRELKSESARARAHRQLQCRALRPTTKLFLSYDDSRCGHRRQASNRLGESPATMERQSPGGALIRLSPCRVARLRGTECRFGRPMVPLRRRPEILTKRRSSLASSELPPFDSHSAVMLQPRPTRPVPRPSCQ